MKHEAHASLFVFYLNSWLWGRVLGSSRVLYWQTQTCYLVLPATGIRYSLQSDGTQVEPLSQEGNNMNDLWILNLLLKKVNMEDILRKLVLETRRALR